MATEAPRVAALFVEQCGPYRGMPGVELWTYRRNARLYAGPHPVVAHPPCQLWTNLARVNFKRYGTEHNRPENDHGSFSSALAAVRQYGGVLEHPAGSYAWPTHRLRAPAPDELGWIGAGAGEYVCEVWQSAYGHKARKRTWLFYRGARPPSEGNWAREPGTHQCGWFDRKKPTLSKVEASRTPPPFAEWLVQLARGAR